MGLLAFLIAFSSLMAFAGGQGTNTIWNLTDSTGTNDLVQVDKFGNLKADGSVTVVGSVTAASFAGAVSSAQSSVTVSGATGIVSTAAALVAPTNDISAGFRIRVNGTNYVIALYPN